MITRRELLGAAALPFLGGAASPVPPNIVFLYADDLGYGDTGCYGARRVRTPNLDRMAASGVRFTNAHSPASTCTPSRYAWMTGEYAWRQPGTAILPGDASLIIQPGRFTAPAMLQKAGYTTGAVGKWHLGLGADTLDWNREIRPGPLEVGFDYCYILPATGDRVPCVYVEDRRVVGLDPADPIQVQYGKQIGNEPTGAANPELLKVRPSHGHDNSIVNGISRIGYMSGGKAARWVDEDIADVLTAKAVAFIERQKAKPFFLYFATHDIHVPRVPHPRFAGKSEMGPRGDAIAELDWSVGRILDTLDKQGLTRNTLFVFSSDNGPVVDDGYQDRAVELLGNHKPGGAYRGGKYSAYEAGTRVPFLARWPGRIKPGVSNALVSQVDLLASLAALTGQKLPEDAAPDSFNVLPALLGQSRTGRESLVEQSSALSLIVGDWKAIEAHEGAKRNQTGNELGNDAAPQLFHLSVDPGEQDNVASRYPEKVKELLATLERVRAAKRTRP